MKKAVIYARVSSKDQEREGYSIPAQKRLLAEYAEKNQISIAAEFVESESAREAGRKEFENMLRFLHKNKDIKIILVEKTDRLYRNFEDAAKIQKMDLEVRFVKEDLILNKDSNPSDILKHDMDTVWAKNYVLRLSREIRKGLSEKAKQGKYPPGQVPLGYKRDPVTKAIVFDPERAPIVRQIFDWYSTGNYSLGQVRKMAVNAGLTYRGCGRPITLSEVHRILKKKFYLGIFDWEGVEYQGDQQALVDQYLFNKVQAVLREKYKGKYSFRQFVFSRLLTCGQCGHIITAEKKKGKYVYYHCTGYGNTCKPEYYREEDLDKEFLNIVKRISIPPELYEWLKECLESEFKTRKIEITRQRESLQVRRGKIETIMKKAYQDKIEGKISDEFWGSVYKNWETELSGINYQLQNMENLADLNYDWAEEAIELSYLAGSLYLNAEPADKRKLLQSILSNCELKGGSLYPVYKKPFDILSNGHEPDKWWRRWESNPRPKIRTKGLLQA
jgi:site-specific DNA recombinase